MSRLFQEEVESTAGATSLKDELASLKIDRKRHRPPASAARPSGGTGLPARRRDGGSFVLRVLSFLLWLIPLGIIGGAGYFAYNQYQNSKPKVTVSTVPVRSMTAGEANTVLEAKGYLKSRFQAQLGAKVPGRVAEIRIEEGTPVKKGDILAILEHDDLKATLESRKAMLARSSFDLEEARSDMLNKRERAQRYQRLAALGQSSDEEADQAIYAYHMAESKIGSLEASIKLQESMMNEIVVSIEDMHVRAPFDGTVVAKGAEVGETIMLGGMGAASGRGSVATVANLRLMEVETDVTESMLGRLSMGQAAEVSVSAVPNTRYKGRLRRVVPLGDRARGTVKVYVEILDPDDRLFPELVATVNFLPGSSEGTAIAASVGERKLYVQRSAIVEIDGKTSAWILDREGLVHKRDVQVAFEDDRARVIEGLSDGENVVNKPPADLVEGQRVELAD